MILVRSFFLCAVLFATLSPAPALALTTDPFHRITPVAAHAGDVLLSRQLPVFPFETGPEAESAGGPRSGMGGNDTVTVSMRASITSVNSSVTLPSLYQQVEVEIGPQQARTRRSGPHPGIGASGHPAAPSGAAQPLYAGYDAVSPSAVRPHRSGVEEEETYASIIATDRRTGRAGYPGSPYASQYGGNSTTKGSLY